MADEITFSALSDATVAATLHQEILQKLGDRNSLWGHPAIAYLGSVNGSGSNVKKGFIDGMDLAPMAAVSDGSAVSNTSISGYTSAVSVTVARQALMWTPTDLAGLTWAFPAGMIERIAGDLATSAKMRFQSLLCDVVDGFTTTVGTSGVDMSVSTWFAAKAAIESSMASGPFIAILHTTQYNDLVSSLRGETGPLMFHGATTELMALKGSGYKGSFDGVDIYVSSHVPTANAGADRAGALFSRGAVAYADGLPTPQVAVGGISIGSGPLFVEVQRDAALAATKVVGNYYLGLAKAQDGMGVTIVSDA